MFFLLTGLAIAGDRWSGYETDVVATAQVERSPEDVYYQLKDLKRLSALFPEDCAAGWEFGGSSVGAGARAAMTYTPGAMNRTLAAELTEPLDAARLQAPGQPAGELTWGYDLVHFGKKGFTTRVRIVEAPGGSEVTVATYLSYPPWPTRRHFFLKVHPAWVACYQDVVGAL